MQSLTALAHTLGTLLPGFAGEERAAVHSVLHQLGALIVDAASAERIVPYFTVAHVRVTGHTDGHSMCVQGRVQGMARKPIEIGLSCQEDCVRFILFAEPH